jgi:hypothetical protein
MIDFPANPTNGQQFTAAGVTWTWDGTKWEAAGLSVAYLPLAGGTLTGPLTLATDPTTPLQAATKEYVDYIEASYPLGDNRIINGDMRIDQRNNGASGTATGYTVDRWVYAATQPAKMTWGRGVNPAAGALGFPYIFGLTSSSAYAAPAAEVYALVQRIEADMVSDFAFGTANAKSITLSFWFEASQVGTFSGNISNDVGTRTYPFTFSNSAATTWTRIVITIPGDTAGTWVMSGNALSMIVSFDLGSGANFRGPANAWASANYVGVTGSISTVAVNGATFIVTGVKLEVGSVATPFNRQSPAKSLADCQRYYQTIGSILCQGYAPAGQNVFETIMYATTMRAAPTFTPISAAYINASALGTNALNPDAATFQTTITALGIGWAAFGALLSAEL